MFSEVRRLTRRRRYRVERCAADSKTPLTGAAQSSGVRAGAGSARTPDAGGVAVAVCEAGNASCGPGAIAPVGAGVGSIIVEPPAGARIEGGGLLLGGIAGTDGCFSPGSRVILPLCKAFSSSRISLYWEMLVASVAL